MLIQTEINEIDNILNVNRNGLIIAFSKSDEEKKNLCISCFKDDISVLPFLCHVRTSRNGKFTEHTHHS